MGESPLLGTRQCPGDHGAVPPAEVFKAQPKWAFFMLWAGMVRDSIKPAYENPYFINRGDAIPGN